MLPEGFNLDLKDPCRRSFSFFPTNHTNNVKHGKYVVREIKINGNVECICIAHNVGSTVKHPLEWILESYSYNLESCATMSDTKS